MPLKDRDLKFVDQGFVDKSSTRLGSKFLLCVVVTWLTLTSNLLSQQVSESNWKRGYHGFNMIVEGIGLEHQSIRAWQAIPEKEKIVVLLGDLRPNLRLAGWLNVDGYLKRGGAMLVASDTSGPLGRLGINFIGSEVNAREDLDSFSGFADCPIISDVELPIPNIYGLRMVTNRPGVLYKDPASIWDPLAYLPPVMETQRKLLFSAGGENAEGGKLICFSDQSVFSNQMLMCGDNAVVAKLSLQYLAGLNRKYILFVGNGEIQQKVSPSDLNVEIPQPTREEVVDALKELPPSALLEFANSVVSMVEDENLVNEYLGASVDKIRPEIVNRFFIFLAFVVACVVALVVYIWQKKLLRKSTSDIVSAKAERNRKDKNRFGKKDASKAKLTFERQMAVLAMLDSFCLEHIDRRFNDLAAFPDELHLPDDVLGLAIRDEMRVVGDDFKMRPRAFWTKKRLLRVETAMSRWRDCLKSRVAAGGGHSTDENIRRTDVNGAMGTR
ncbi:MAG: hypothetical protein P8J27_06130 [Mariniblastus sp.]|nr:hypothetical protein [Mariniblastus sp.]